MSTQAPATGAAPAAAELPASAVPSADYVTQMTSAVHADPIPAQVAATPAAPAVPDKFRKADGQLDADKLLASYLELEKERSKAAPAASQSEAPANPDPAQAKPGAKIERPADPAEASKASEPAPLATAIDALKSAYEGGQELNDDLVKPLLDAGLPREVVDTYFAGLKAIEATIELTAHQVAGGKEAFEQARNWAANSLSDQELDYYNAQASNPATAKQAVEWLMAKYGTANPSEGRMVEADPAGASGGDTFASQYELTQAMQSPQYKVDPAYRQQVAEKLQRSIRAGTLTPTTNFYAR